MKISNSKKQLAKIIHENGGWRERAEFAAQDKKHAGKINKVVFYCGDKPRIGAGYDFWHGSCFHEDFIIADNLIQNWHQTILSRDEYFHLHPAQVKVAVENKTACHLTVTDKPTIEQLAADYRNRKDFADRKQQEADAAKADAEAKLAELVAAGKALGLVLSVVGVEPELVVTDWRDLRVGDCIWVGNSAYARNCPAGEYNIVYIDRGNDDQPVGVMWNGRVLWPQIHDRGWRFIRRPAKGEANA